MAETETVDDEGAEMKAATSKKGEGAEVAEAKTRTKMAAATARQIKTTDGTIVASPMAVVAVVVEAAEVDAAAVVEMIVIVTPTLSPSLPTTST